MPKGRKKSRRMQQWRPLGTDHDGTNSAALVGKQAATSLVAQARELRDAVAVFRLRADTGEARPLLTAADRSQGGRAGTADRLRPTTRRRIEAQISGATEVASCAQRRAAEEGNRRGRRVGRVPARRTTRAGCTGCARHPPRVRDACVTLPAVR